jgi:hypothetical protein
MAFPAFLAALSAFKGLSSGNEKDQQHMAGPEDEMLMQREITPAPEVESIAKRMKNWRPPQ